MIADIVQEATASENQMEEPTQLKSLEEEHVVKKEVV